MKKTTFIKTLLVVVCLLTGTNVWADGKILYSQNYESESDASTWTTTLNNTTLTLETDGGQGYGKYIKFYASGAGGDRCAYTNFYTTGNDFYSDNTSYTMEFDATIRMGNTAEKPTHLVVASEGYSFAYNESFASKNTTNKNYLFLLENASGAAANSTTYYINGGSTAYTIAADSWFHVRLDVNVSTKTINYTLSGAVTASGSYTIEDASSIKAQGIVANINKGTYGTVKIDNIAITAGHLENITYNLNVGSSASTTISSSTSTSDVTNISSISIDQTNAAGDGNGAGTNRTTKLPIKTGANGETFDTPTNYVLFKYSVAEGKQFTPTGITIRVANVGSSSANNIKYKATLSDASNSISGTYVGTCQDGTVEFFNLTNGAETAFTGDVTLKLWAWTIEDGSGKGSAFRMGTPLEIKGVVETLPEIVNAIADCKTYETSAAFETAIDAESFASAAEVYAFHSAWQIAQAQANGSTDYSKAIMNRTFELHNTNGWTIYGDAATGGSTDNDKYGVVEYGEGWSQYYTGWNGRNVSQTIASLPAGTYTLTAKVYSWSGGAPVRLFANGQLSDAENGDDHDPVLVFTVAGNEPSIKIGIGGTGNNNDTDNTWGTWGYRVKNFTLTRTSVSASLGTNGYGTFASNYPLDLTTATQTASGVTAYKASVSGTTVTFTALDQTVPANTGILIKGTPSTSVNIPVVASGTAVDGNDFLVNTAGTTFAGDGDYYYFGMLKDSDPLKFGQFTPGTVAIPANKAYLKVLKSTIDAGARELNVVFDDNDATAISEAKSQQPIAKSQFFDLQGRRVAQPTKGLYIVNGRKVVVK